MAGQGGQGASKPPRAEFDSLTAHQMNSQQFIEKTVKELDEKYESLNSKQKLALIESVKKHTAKLEKDAGNYTIGIATIIHGFKEWVKNKE